MSDEQEKPASGGRSQPPRLRERDRATLRDVEEALETAATRMARVVCETSASDDLRAFVQKQWLRLAKIQTAFEEHTDGE